MAWTLGGWAALKRPEGRAPLTFFSRLATIESKEQNCPVGSQLQIVPLDRNSRALSRFLGLSYAIYRDDPYWVAPLLSDLKKVFRDANPFLDHAEMQLWMAVQDGRDVGRIAGIVDQNHNQTHRDNAAFFGFFESVNDPPVSQALFEAVFAWAQQKGMRRVIGPMNPSTNDECGLLVEGFDSSPVFMMTYNPSYYIGLVERAGFQKAKDLLAFYIDIANSPMDRLERVAARVRQRYPELTVRPVRRKSLEEDLAKIKAVYNEAWNHNWGFVPMTDAEMDFLAGRLKPLLLEGLVQLAESPQGPVAFLLALPDYNEAFKLLRGRLLTPKALGFLPYMVGWKVPRGCRVIILGVRDGYRNHGLEAAMLLEGFKTGFRVGFRSAEASWILEDNVEMRQLMKAFGGRPYKTYRLYTREL
jgi:hypothetical protein